MISTPRSVEPISKDIQTRSPATWSSIVASSLAKPAIPTQNLKSAFPVTKTNTPDREPNNPEAIRHTMRIAVPGSPEMRQALIQFVTILELAMKTGTCEINPDTPWPVYSPIIVKPCILCYYDPKAYICTYCGNFPRKSRFVAFSKSSASTKTPLRSPTLPIRPPVLPPSTGPVKPF